MSTTFISHMLLVWIQRGRSCAVWVHWIPGWAMKWVMTCSWLEWGQSLMISTSPGSRSMPTSWRYKVLNFCINVHVITRGEREIEERETGKGSEMRERVRERGRKGRRERGYSSCCYCVLCAPWHPFIMQRIRSDETHTPCTQKHTITIASTAYM